ncbi:hypothetical protein CORC01_09653, partial [Colletotrichum orchidophilum]
GWSNPELLPKCWPGQSPERRHKYLDGLQRSGRIEPARTSGQYGWPGIFALHKLSETFAEIQRRRESMQRAWPLDKDFLAQAKPDVICNRGLGFPSAARRLKSDPSSLYGGNFGSRLGKSSGQFPSPNPRKSHIKSGGLRGAIGGQWWGTIAGQRDKTDGARMDVRK